MRSYVSIAQQVRVWTEHRNGMPRILFGAGSADWSMSTITSMAPAEAEKLVDTLRTWEGPGDSPDDLDPVDFPDCGMTVGPGPRGALVIVFDTSNQQGDPNHKVVWHVPGDLAMHVAVCLIQTIRASA